MSRVRITDSTGTVRDTIPLVRLVKEQPGINTATVGRITVTRDDLNGVSGLAPGEDRVFVEDDSGVDVFGGVLRTPGRSGGRPIMLVDDFSIYMQRAQPVPLGEHKVAIDDATLIQECIDSTPQLTAGTIETVESGQTWIFSGITQRAKASKVAEATGGELVFNPDLTVDYLTARGADKTSTTLSPSNRSFVEDTFNADRDGVAGNITHLKVYGIGQGTSQIEATVVPAADSSSYTNEVTYTNPNWSDGDDEIWGRRTNKDLKNVAALQAWGETLIEDLQEEEIRVETVVKGNTVELGDQFRVSHPEEDIDDDLRVVELTTLRSSAGVRYEAVFSNYDVAHVNRDVENHKDVGRYNQAFEGDLTNVQQSPGRGPIGPNHDYFIYVYYPDDVVAEVNSQLLVKGTNYRAYVAGSAGGGDHTHSVPVNTSTASSAGSSEFQNPIDLASSSDISDTFTLPNVTGDGGWALIYLHVSYDIDGSDPGSGQARISNNSTSTTLYSDGSLQSFQPGDSRLYQVVQTGDVEGDTIQIEWFNSAGGRFRISYAGIIVSTHTHSVSSTETSDASGDHTHAPDPGILDWDGSEKSPAHYPENVDVLVNGSSQGVSLGDGTGEFEETVDVANQLTTGWNTIRLTSAGLGHLDASFSADLFRQSL